VLIKVVHFPRQKMKLIVKMK
jgi:hypothetical protein